MESIELAITETEKIEEEKLGVWVEKEQVFSFAHINFTMAIVTPNGNVNLDIQSGVQGRDPGWR